jgi:cellulose synthase (UDP-forming)
MEILRKDNPLRTRGLTFAQRLSYFTSAAYVIEYVPKAIYLVVPPIVLFTGVLPMTHMGWGLLFRFLPYYLLGLATSHALTRGSNPFLRAERFHLLKIAIMLRALSFLAWPRKLKFKVTSKSVTGDARRLPVLRQIKGQIVVGGACVVGVIWGATSWFFDAPWSLPGLSLLLTIAWATVNAGLLGSLVRSLLKRRHRRQNYRFQVQLPLVAKMGSRTETVTTSDLSPTGVGWTASRWYGLGQRVKLTLLPVSSSTPIELDATVTACRLAGAGFKVGAEFVDIDAEAERRVVLMLFQEVAPTSVSDSSKFLELPRAA